MFTARIVSKVFCAEKGTGSGDAHFRSSFNLSKLNAIEADTGIQCPVFVVTVPGTTIEQVKALPGFMLDTDKPIFRESKRSVTFQGMYDTSGTNLLDGSGLNFVVLIEGPIDHGTI